MRLILLCFLLSVAFGRLPAQAPPRADIPIGYTPHRVYDTKAKRFVDLESMTARLSRADAVFLGEFHDDPGTHRLQHAVLEGLARRRSTPMVLSLEMFERDVQPSLDAYRADRLPEADFLAQSRPWSNYPSDYRPLVEFAKANDWSIVAANVPRRLAQRIARGGLGSLDSLPDADRPFVAATHNCPRDAYFRKFEGVMGDMSGHGMQLTPDQVSTMVWRTYEAQCAKDETMAESIVAARLAHGTAVVHVNGAFHSDHRLGTVERVKRRAPGDALAVVSFVPVADLDRADGKPMRKQADFIVFTLAPARPAP